MVKGSVLRLIDVTWVKMVEGSILDGWGFWFKIDTRYVGKDG